MALTGRRHLVFVLNEKGTNPVLIATAARERVAGTHKAGKLRLYKKTRKEVGTLLPVSFTKQTGLQGFKVH